MTYTVYCIQLYMTERDGAYAPFPTPFLVATTLCKFTSALTYMEKGYQSQVSLPNTQ